MSSINFEEDQAKVHTLKQKIFNLWLIKLNDWKILIKIVKKD